jgi:hypothetical protein
MNLDLYCDADHGELLCRDRVIDIVEALDLLDSCVRDPGHGYRSLPRRLAAVSSTEPQDEALAASGSIVTLALRRAGAPLTALRAVAHAPIADVYASGRPDLNLTLGAAVVFRAAESAERQGQPWAMCLQAALQTAARFVELIPDRFAACAAGAVTAPDRGASLAPQVNRARIT